MDCAGCGHLNAATSRFCAHCGTSLLRTCPSCNAEQSPGANFCDQCGGSLASGVAEPPIVPMSRPTAVRKQVTALFADLVGSTAFGERVDPEAARAALAPYFEILRSAVEDHAGTVVKFTGDGVLAVFGLPEVAEDDARRAVATGQDLQRRFDAFAATVRDRHGVELGLRVGVNSGELVVGDDDEDLVGDVLNTAARLEAACSPGRVLVGEDTWRLTRSGVRYEVLGEISVKGKAEPIATFQVAELPDAAIEEHIPFVGRDAELADLLDAFAEARDSPVLRLVTVVGDPGVGKTRLASEVRGATSARSFDLRFERRGSTTFGPIADLLRLVTDGTADGAARLLDEHAERDRLVPILASMLGHDAVRSTEESFWGVRRLLEHLADQHGPLLVVVDDIQWAEPLFWDLLDHLVEWTEAPVLVIALARPELRELRPELTQAGRRLAASIALEGLGADDTRELAARLLDVEELPRELTDRIPASTDGNPLFVRELVNMLVDDGTLERDGDRWRLTIDADAIDVPPTILSLLASRVERLPDDERRAIELASVIGTDFDRGTLAAIASEDGSTGPLGVVLDRLRRRDLVEPSGAWSGDHPVYRFHHVLVRDAAYRRLLKQRRATLHELVGRHVDEHHATGDETDVVVAHHFEQVVRYRRDLGIVDEATDALAREAVVRLRRSADAALAREDLPAAGSSARRALDLVDESSADRDELLLVGCEALLSSGDVVAAEPLVRELADRSTDERLAAWGDCFRAQRWSLTDPDRLSEATDVADRAADVLAALGDAAGVAKARLVRAGCLARLGRVGECENELDLALSSARDAGDRRRTVAVLGAAPLAALWGPSPVSRAGGRCLDVLRLLRITTASPAVETTSIRCQAVLEALRGRLDSAREKLEQSRSTSRELGLRQGLYETEMFAGFVELWAGDPAAAEPHLRAAHEGLGRLGIGADAGQAAALLARTLLGRGDIDAADAFAAEALGAAGQNLQTAIASRSALAEVRASQGRHDEAASLIAEAIEIAGRTDIVLDHALAAEAAARVGEMGGDSTAVSNARAEARRLLTEKGITAERGLDPDQVGDGEPAGPATLEGTGQPREEQAGADRIRAEQQAAEAETDRPRASGLPDGPGWQAIEAAVQAWIDDDEVAWRRCYADDFLGAGRERLSAQRSDVGLDEWATASFVLRRQVIEIDVVVERVAQRGEHWFVLQAMGTADGDEIGFVFVSQLVGGLIRRETVFDPTQLDEAIALADDGFHVENGIEDLAWIRDLHRVMYSVDPELLEQRLADDYVLRDHRQMSWHDLTRDDLIGAIRANPDPFVVSVPMVWRSSESGVVCHRVESTSDGASVSGWLAVAEIRDRLVQRMDIFDEDDLDKALAHYDRLADEVGRADEPNNAAAEPAHGWADTEPSDPTLESDARDPGGLPELTNAANEIVVRFLDARNEADWDSALAVLHPDLEVRTHRPEISALGLSTLKGRSEWMDGLRNMTASSTAVSDVVQGAPQLQQREVLAVRGDQLVLARSVEAIDGNELPYLMLAESRDGQIITLTQWSSGQLGEAVAALEQRWFELNGGPIDDFARRWVAAYVTHDIGEVERLLAPTYETVDHRSIGLGRRDRSDFLESTVPVVAHGVVFLMAQQIEVSDRCALAESSMIAGDDLMFHGPSITLIDGDGRSELGESFDIAQLEEARRRFHELTDESPHRPLTNTAAQLIERMWSIGERGDAAEMARILHPTFEGESRRQAFSALGVPPDDRDHVVSRTGARDQRQAAELSQLGDRVILATRGNDLAAGIGVEEWDGFVLPFAGVAESAEGRLVWLCTWDEPDVQDALDELDRRWVERGGPEPLVEVMTRFRRLGRDGDAAAVEAFVSPDLESVDHRSLGMGVRGYREWVDSMTPLAGRCEFVMHEVLAHTERIGLIRGTVSQADEGSWELLYLLRVDAEGRVDRYEIFDWSDEHRARARFDELVSASLVGSELVAERFLAVTNNADRLSMELLAAQDQCDLGAIDRLLHSDFEFDERSSAFGALGGQVETKVEYLADFAEYCERVNGDVQRTVDRQVIAVRGDELCLCRGALAREDHHRPYLALVESTGDQIRRVAFWDEDQFDEAFAEFDRAWVAGGGPEGWVGYDQRYRAAFRSGTIDDLARIIAADFVSIDHRPLGLGQRGRPEWLASVEPIVGRSTVVMHHAVARGSVLVGRVSLRIDESESTLIDGLVVAEFDDRWHQTRQELFGLDQWEQCRARFEELTAEAPSEA